MHILKLNVYIHSKIPVLVVLCGIYNDENMLQLRVK